MGLRIDDVKEPGAFAPRTRSAQTSPWVSRTNPRGWVSDGHKSVHRGDRPPFQNDTPLPCDPSLAILALRCDGQAGAPTWWRRRARRPVCAGRGCPRTPRRAPEHTTPPGTRLLLAGDVRLQDLEHSYSPNKKENEPSTIGN